MRAHTQMDLDWAFQMKGPVPQVSRQALVPGGSVEISHENLFGDSQSLSVSLSSSDWRNPGADLGFQMSYTEPFYAPNTTRNVQVRRRAARSRSHLRRPGRPSALGQGPRWRGRAPFCLQEGVTWRAL